MNAVEYHKFPEVNLAMRLKAPFLGDVRDIKNGRYHTDSLEAFYIPSFTAIELFSTTLHFAPCKVDAKGFICAVVIIGELGGTREEEVAKRMKNGDFTKPLLAFLGGRTAPKGQKMGHAGAIVTGGKGSAEDKIEALEDAGALVVKRPSEVGKLLEQLGVEE